MSTQTPLKESFLVFFTTDFRPEAGARKSRPMLYDFSNHDACPDTLSWPKARLSTKCYCSNRQEAEAVYDEIVREKEDWKPLAELKGTPECLNHVCVVRLDEDGTETLEHLWLDEETEAFPEYLVDVFHLILEKNRDEFDGIKRIPRRIVRFPSAMFTAGDLVNESLSEEEQFAERCGTIPFHLDCSLGMGVKLSDGLFVRLRTTRTPEGQLNHFFEIVFLKD